MHRKSKQKNSILKAIKETDSHPTAEWIYQQVRREIPSLSLGTVYRNLRLLEEEGEISELGSTSMLSRFDGSIHNHYHFRCEQCDRVFNVKEPVNEEVDKRVARETGFEISHHILEFQGLCKECQSLIH